MAASREVMGGNSPAWLGPTLLGVGLVAWMGAGVTADASLSPAVDAEVGAPAPVPAPEVAPEPEPEPEPEPVVVLDDEPEPKPPKEPEVCAPQVELMFANGESELDRTEILRGFTATAAQFPDHKIVVEGYASADGSEEGNLQLSHRRASRAKTNLVEQGIDAERITVQAFGEYRPNLDGDIDRDRRVIVKIQGVAACPEKAAEE